MANKKAVRLSVYGMEAVGATAQEAKENAGRRIEAALKGSFLPTIVRHGERIALVFRTTDGWNHKIIDGETPSGTVFGGTMHAAQTTEQQAIRAAVMHLAQNAGSFAGLERWLDKQAQDELIHLFKWQASYLKARNGGASHDDAIASAGVLG